MKGENIEPVPCYAETDAPFEHHWAPLRALITDRYKYIKTTREELYDLVEDPSETHNVARADGNQRDNLAAALDEMCAKFEPRKAGTVHLSPKEQQILESLGYLSGKAAVPKEGTHEQLPDIKDMMPVYNMVLAAKDMMAARQTAAAIDALHAALELAPQYGEARIMLGDALTSEKKFLEATEVYEAVLADNSDQPMAHAHLGHVLAAQGRLQEAVPHYRRALEIDSEGASWHFQLARILWGLGNFPAAITEYEQAIRCDPGYVQAHMDFGTLLIKFNRNEEAIRHFEIALKLHPNLPEAHLNLGLALARGKRNSEALAHTQKAVELDPENFDARFNLATLYLIEQRFQDALEQINEARRLRPDDPRPTELLKRARAALNSKSS